MLLLLGSLHAGADGSSGCDQEFHDCRAAWCVIA